MFIVAAPVIFAAAFGACVAIAQTARRRPLGLAMVLAAALLVFFETLLLNLLSVFQAVGRPGLLLGNSAIALAGFAVSRWRRRDRPRLRWPQGADGPLLLPVAAIGLLAAVSALAYCPNNWDSMTYHLARVAHWYQKHSVFPYPSNITRQIALPPGAEHLLLVLQVIAGSDVYANLVQFGAWVVLVMATPALVRTFGAPRRAARWSALLIAAAPMAILQASSTQNDLVAAAMSVAIVVACVPFLHQPSRWRPADLVLLVAVVTAGLLVKPTSVIASAPFLVWGIVRTARDFGKVSTWQRLSPVVLALALALGALGPSLLARRASPGFDAVVNPFLYTGADTFGDRVVNSLRGLLRNVPVSGKMVDRLSPSQTIGCDKANSLCLRNNWQTLHEDMTGNPGLALSFILAVTIGCFRPRSLPRRAPLAILCLASSWFLFHALVRDNVWIPRLQLPLFALAPIALCALSGSWSARGPRGLAMGLLLAALAAHGAMAAVLNARRPVDPSKLLDAHSAQSYYALGPTGVMKAHAAAIAFLEKSSCRRLGIYITEDSYDYPLTWRAIHQGAEVRHVVGPDDWPCIVFSDRGPPPIRPLRDAWRQVSPSLYVVQ
jgi:hypothetical protein